MMYINQIGNSVMKNQVFVEQPSMPKILLVDDTPLNIKVAKLLLAECGDYTIVTADSSMQALTCYQNEKFDLVILDIGLPDISGIQLCSLLREKFPRKKVPVIAYTAFGEEITKECLDVGINDFLFKPVTLENVKKVLQKYLTVNAVALH